MNISRQKDAGGKRRRPAGAGLRAAVDALDGPMLVERSAKFMDGQLQAGRFLLSIPKSALYPGPSGRLERICREHGAPGDALDVLAPHVRAANNVHFGFEPEDGGDRVKCYLEFPMHGGPRENLVFLAIKWLGSSGDIPASYAVSRYWSRTGLEHAGKTTLADAILPAGPARDAAHGMLHIARQGAPDGRAAVLEVEEAGNPRRSLDINLADAGRTLNQLRDLLRPLFDGAQAEAAFDGLLAREGEALMGHFGAGVGRTGSPFATLYYGAAYG